MRESGRDIPTSEFDKMMDINLKASFLLAKGVVGDMKDNKWGRIIFISSIAAYGAGINGCRK
jgi:3-oxoacyl-[acyl-carrier protein] reductase